MFPSACIPMSVKAVVIIPLIPTGACRLILWYLFGKLTDTVMIMIIIITITTITNAINMIIIIIIIIIISSIVFSIGT